MSLHVGLNVVRGYIYHLCTANFDTFWGFPRPSPTSLVNTLHVVTGVMIHVMILYHVMTCGIYCLPECLLVPVCIYHMEYLLAHCTHHNIDR